MEITIIESFKNDLKLLMKTYLSEINFFLKKNNLEKKDIKLWKQNEKKNKKEKKEYLLLRLFFNEIDFIYII